MWHLGYVFALQFLLMCSVFVVYFRSNVVRRSEPQQMLMKHPPADRLVIFIVDGLSAKSFFENRCSNVQELSNIFLHQGQVGIIRTLGSTDCRSAQAALFSGFYKNSISVFGDWLWKDINFDTIFNRATLSYAWGSTKSLKYLPVQNKVNVPNDVISTAAKDSYKLDKWVFEAVDRFLDSESQHLQKVDGLVLVVHLLGLLEANGMQMYRENINYTQRGIWRTYNRFEQTFPDQHTAYLLISDHGMTDRGLFGGNSKEEIETPFLLWGAGVSNTNSSPGRSFVADKRMKRLPLNILEQIQLTPLMSTLVGLPPPMHNRGQMPAGLLNASDRYESYAIFTNALQLVNLAKHRLEYHCNGLLANYMSSHWMNLRQLDKFVYSANLLWHQKRFLTLKEYSSNIMPVLLQCIEYYDNYYRRGLLLATAFSFLGWQHYLRCQLASSSQTYREHSTPLLVAKTLLHLLTFFLIIYLLLQRVPWIVSSFLLLPGCIWWLALNEHERKAKLSPCMPLLLSLSCLTGFIDRRLMALCYLGFVVHHNRVIFLHLSLESTVWIIVVCALTSLSWLPPTLGFYHRGSIIASMMITLVQPTTFLGHNRPLTKNLICNGLVLLIAAIHVWFSETPWLLHLIARSYLCYVFYPRFGYQGIEVTIYSLSTLYTLLCTSYEAVVIQMLVFELQLALRLKNENCIPPNLTIAMYMIMYSFYSFFVIGNIADVHKFHILMAFSGFGLYSTFISGLVIALKLCIPVLLILCVVCSKYVTTWTNRRDIFYKLLVMCNGMAVVCLFRVHDNGSLWEIGVRIFPFIIVQLLPFILLLLTNLADLLVGENRKHSLEIPKWNVHLR